MSFKFVINNNDFIDYNINKEELWMRKHLFLLLFLFLSFVSYSQEQPTVIQNLEKLNLLINNIESNTIEQQNELQVLKQTIADSIIISEAQAAMLADLRRSQTQQLLIQEKQAILLKQSLYKSKVLTMSLIIGVPVVIATTALITLMITN
jgi:hypothetical protein